MYFKYAAAAVTALLPLCSAQTFSDCNPLEKTCDPVKGLASSSFTSDFTKGDSAFDGWTTAAGKVTTGSQGAEFTVAKKGDAPTIDTDFYIFYGKVEVTLKAAPGVGIVSSIVLESDVLDEIDWEALGGDTTQIQTNYFGKGDTSSYDRATYETVATPQETFHTYTVDWNSEQISWAIDGNVVRTLAYNDAKGGTRFPQTPARLRLGIWAGGDSDNAPGTIEWAGGQTDYNAAPFTMYVQSVTVTNYNPASSYTYSDNSGSSSSIKKTGAIDDTSSSSTTSGPTSTSSTSSSSSTSSAGSTTESSAESSTQPATTGVSTTVGSTATTGGAGSASASQTGSQTDSQAGSASPTASGMTTVVSSSATGGAGAGSGSTTGAATGGAGSGSATESGAAGAGSGSASPSGSATDSSSNPLFTGAASTMGSSMSLLALLGLMTAMLQL